MIEVEELILEIEIAKDGNFIYFAAKEMSKNNVKLATNESVHMTRGRWQSLKQKVSTMESNE